MSGDLLDSTLLTMPDVIFCYALKSVTSRGFWAQIFFVGLNQKSATISMCKIHIYIDSESFRQILLKNVGVGFLVNDTWAKWGFEIWPLW